MKPEHLPNIITGSRILLTPLFIWLMMSNDGILVQFSAGIFLLAAVSDWYDGWYARKYNAMTRFGKFFDPLADKVLISSAFFAFAFLERLPLWMVFVVVGRDILVTVLRVIADRRGQPVVTSKLAKWKTAMQLIFLWYVVVAFTLHNIQWLNGYVTRPALERLFDPWIINTSMFVLTILSIVTAVQYLIENRHILHLSNGNIVRTPS